jgi:hypothetical protein
MSPFRPDRSRRGEDPHLRLKMLLFVTGAAFGIGGIATDRGWLVYIGMAILAVALVLRMVAARVARRSDDGRDEDVPDDR